MSPLKTPLELNNDVLIPYKEKKKTLNNIKQEQKQRPKYMSTTQHAMYHKELNISLFGL